MASDRWERTRVPDGLRVPAWRFNARKAAVYASFLVTGTYTRTDVARALRRHRQSNDPREVGRLWLAVRVAREEAR